ncbi:MAG TPA: hypothetical protein VFL95_07700 [Gemmatimonadales bacterium]|nr:hypothetical protein [Gemmatimonadales bacterium]
MRFPVRKAINWPSGDQARSVNPPQHVEGKVSVVLVSPYLLVMRIPFTSCTR